MSDPRLPTYVGRAADGENHFRGRSVERELAGGTRLADLVAIAVGIEVNARGREVLELLAVLCCAADPRIWPLKVGRVAGAYGGFLPSVSSVLLTCHRGALGAPAGVSRAANVLTLYAERRLNGEASEQIVDELFRQFGRVPGFGVAGRKLDERAICADCHLGDQPAKWYALHLELRRAVREQRGLEANFALPMAAALLDLGVEAAQLPAISTLLLLPCIVANSFEAAQQAPEILREMPAEFVEYVGPPPRLSPRAQAAANADSPESPEGEP